MKIHEIITETREENFKRWFGNSKVVDGAGRPLVVYHGTISDFAKFDSSGHRSGSAVQELGTWFASTAKAASKFAKDPEWGGTDGANIIPVYLSIQNPKIISGGWKGLEKSAWPEGYDHNTILKWKKDLVAGGHDGIILLNSKTDRGGDRTDFVVFRPTQIKSATCNKA
jgi:hypothetical protein